MREQELIIEYKKLGFGKPFKTWYNTVDSSYYPENIVGLVQFLGEKYHIIISASNEQERLNQIKHCLKICQRK